MHTRAHTHLCTNTHTESFCQIWINTNTGRLDCGMQLGDLGERLAYLAISDLLSGPECRMTAGERPQRLETCLHLCISHINKFSHRCIQTSLSALLHTTHSCHKHSDTQSTTREREGKRKREGEERENGGEKRAAKGDGGEGKARQKPHRGRRWDENVERRATAAEQRLALSGWAGMSWKWADEQHGWKNRL